MNDVEKNLKIKIEDLGLSIRSTNCLKNFRTFFNDNVDTVGDLVRFTAEDLGTTRNFGKKSTAEIVEKLAQLGLRLGMDNTALPVSEEYEGIELQDITFEEALKNTGWKYVHRKSTGIEYKVDDLISKQKTPQRFTLGVVTQQENFLVVKNVLNLDIFAERKEWTAFGVHNLPDGFGRGIYEFQQYEDSDWLNIGDETPRDEIIIRVVRNMTPIRYRRRAPILEIPSHHDIFNNVFKVGDIWRRVEGFNEKTKEYLACGEWVSKFFFVGLEIVRTPQEYGNGAQI